MLRFRPGLNGTLLQGQSRIRNYQIEIQSDGVSKTLAGRTSPVRIVEAKQARFGLCVDGAVILALKPVRELKTPGFRFSCFDYGRTVSLLETGLQRVD